MAAIPAQLLDAFPTADAAARPAGPTIGSSGRVRRSPFHDRVMAAGVLRMTVYNHMLLPMGYVATEEAYWHLLEHVQIWDVAGERQVEIEGPDALRLVELMTPRPMASCAVGQCRYAPLVDERGGVVNDPVALRLAEDRFWLSLADSDVLLWAKGLAHGLGLDVRLHEPDVSPLAVQGPKADAVLEALLGAWTRELGFFRFREVTLQGIPLVVARSGWSKQGGFELYLRDGTRGCELWDLVVEAGAPHDIRPGTPNAIERIESGLLSYGGDMTLADSPRQCGLEGFTKIDKRAAYVARKALEREAGTAPDRRLARIVIGGSPVAGVDLPWAVSRGGRTSGAPIGLVTSAEHSPRLSRNIGFAMLPMDAHTPEADLLVHTPDGQSLEARYVGDINADCWRA